MSFSFGFFNAKNMDRTYTAEDFTGYLSSIICNGVFDTYGDCFSVTAGSGTKVIIGTGKAWIDGHYFINDTAYTLDLSKYVDESLSRYVTIGISCDVSENIRACKLEVKSGTAATSPAIPVFEDTASKKFLTLAAVYLKGGAKSITDGNIRDMRENEEKCGYVKCVLGKCRVSEMLVAVAFMTDKMNEMVGKIDTLQSTVDMLQLKVDDLTGDIIATGPLGKDIYYVLYSNGNLLIRGIGEMYNYDIDGNQSPFLGNNEIRTVVVSEGVTSIGENVFENCQSMESITLPTTLTSIGHAAFMQGDGYVNTVYGLTEINIPSGVTNIGGSAFWGSAIQNLVIPASVTEIGKYACRDCAALKSVTINGTVIGEFMFVSCTKLSTFNIGSKLKKIGSNVFNYCSALETITYDGTLAQWQAIEKGSNWDGLSAYEIAVQNGFVGTESEWLESLKGKDGADGNSPEVSGFATTEYVDERLSEILVILENLPTASTVTLFSYGEDVPEKYGSNIFTIYQNGIQDLNTYIRNGKPFSAAENGYALNYNQTDFGWDGKVYTASTTTITVRSGTAIAMTAQSDVTEKGAMFLIPTAGKSNSDTVQNYIYTSVTTGNCVELPFYWLYCDTFITWLTACDSATDGEYYLCWVGRSNNSHPIVREVKVMN